MEISEDFFHCLLAVVVFVESVLFADILEEIFIFCRGK